MRILLVDDDPASLLFLTAIVRAQGHEVITARDGEEAYRLIHAQQAALVISDWNMPALTGLELCRKLRAERLPHYVYFILLTARDDRKSLLEGMDAGADDFLVKPVDPGELRVRIRAGERVLRLESELGQRNAALDQLNAELTQAYDIIQKDVGMAAAIQKSLLPEPQVWSGVKLQWLFIPNSLLAGDMLGYFPLDSAHLAFFQIDVSGHGVSSALISFSVSKLLWQQRPGERSPLAGPDGGGSGFLSPDQVIAGLNQRFCNGPESESYFLTMVYGILDVRTGRVELSAAGHPPPLLWHAASGTLAESSARGLPVGVLEDSRYPAESLAMAPGDRLFMFSDGITECPNPQGELFGNARFQALLLEIAGLPAADLPAAIRARLCAWRGSESYPDDISLLILER